jgi:phosphoribosylformylglycinamidine synthase
VREAIADGLLASAHDCSEGGLAVAIAECCIAGGLGADVHLHDELHPVASLFGETQSRIVVSLAESDAEKFVERLAAANVPYSTLGTVGGDRLTICERLDCSLEQLKAAFEPTLEALVHGELQAEELFEG